MSPGRLEREAASQCCALAVPLRSPISLLGAGIQAGASWVLLSQTCLPREQHQWFLMARRSLPSAGALWRGPGQMWSQTPSAMKRR